MKPTVLRSILWILPLAASPEAVAVEPPGVELTLHRTPVGLLAVDVTLAGRQVRAALDTGLSGTLLTPALANRLGLVAAARSTVVDAAGHERPLLLAAEVAVSWGGVGSTLPWVGWTPGAIELPGSDGLEAVVGADALAGVDVLIDPGRRRLRVAPAGALAAWIDGDAIAVAEIEGRPALEVALEKVGGDAGRLQFVIDSGANTVVLFGAAAASALARAGRSGQAIMNAALGARPTDLVRLGRARAGARSLRLGSAAALPEVLDRSEAGLVPLEALGPLRLDMASRSATLSARLRTASR